MAMHRPHQHVTPDQADRARRLSEVHAHSTVVVLTGISSSTLSVLKQRGFRSACRGLRPIPTDWAIVAPGLSQAELQRHYRAGPSTVQRWLRLKPVARPIGGTQALPVPTDLAETLARLSRADAARHYRVSPALIYQWRKKLALDAKGRSTLAWEQRYRSRVAAAAAEARP